jgi:hypothetical protein
LGVIDAYDKPVLAQVNAKPVNFDIDTGDAGSWARLVGFVKDPIGHLKASGCRFTAEFPVAKVT